MIPIKRGLLLRNVSSCCSWCTLHFTAKDFVFSQQALKFQRGRQKDSKSASWNLCGSALFLPRPCAHLKLWPPGYSDPVTPYPEVCLEANAPNWRESKDRLIPSFSHWRLLSLLPLAARENLFLLAAFKRVCVQCHCITPRSVCFVSVDSLVQTRPRSYQLTHSYIKGCMVGC